MIHRVRTIIRYLEYSIVRKTLPKKAFFTGIKKGGNIPLLARKIGYPQFGMYLDWFIRKILALIHKISFIDREQQTSSKIPAYDLYKWCVKHYFSDEPVSKDIFSKDKDYYREITSFVIKNFSKCQNIELEPELVYDNISGHPDIIIDNVIYDIKTTGQFNSMRVQTIFQLLSYYCLAKQNNLSITSIGVVLPAQEMILRVNLDNWNWEPFWFLLKNATNTKISLIPNPVVQINYKANIQPFVGSHISKDSTIYKTLQNVPIELPWQIFLSGRTNSKFKISDTDIAKTRALTEQGYRFYVHSPYVLNLSRRYDDNWVVECLQKHLQVGVAMGCKGIVIHCGIKAKDIDFDSAYQNMYNAVVESAKLGSSECPLLIETSAKETGELLFDPEELAAFYLSLPDETRKNVKICVDTCHVFSAGYIPQTFIEILQKADVPIGLIHFNDSQGNQGCCKDRHAPVGVGYIGLHNLLRTGCWALENKIDLIYE